MSDGIVVEVRVRVRNQLGLHLRPAAELVKLAGRFTAEIGITRDGLSVNGKSIMGVAMLAAERDAELLIRGEGPDAAEAVAALCEFVERGFGEE